jgi:hypothetical protein
MKTIPLTKGLQTVVDDDTHEWASKVSWQAKKGGNHYYAFHGTKILGKFIEVALHRLVAGALKDDNTDHISGDTLDNRRSNLRLCSHAENCRNRARKKGIASQYKGVAWHKRDSKWTAQIYVNNRLKYLGSFASETEAAKTYDAAAREHFGQFARTNFPKETQEQLCQVQ